MPAALPPCGHFTWQPHTSWPMITYSRPRTPALPFQGALNGDGTSFAGAEILQGAHLPMGASNNHRCRYDYLLSAPKRFDRPEKQILPSGYRCKDDDRSSPRPSHAILLVTGPRSRRYCGRRPDAAIEWYHDPPGMIPGPRGNQSTIRAICEAICWRCRAPRRKSS